MEASKLYDAIIRGDDNSYEGLISATLIDQIIPGGQQNTLLHLVAMHGATRIAEMILETYSTLLIKQNVEGDSPLHLAARSGHLQVAEMLVKWAEDGNNNLLEVLLEMENRYKESALYDVILSGCLEMVVLLISKHKRLSEHFNNEFDSPLFLALSRKFEDIDWHILSETPDCYSSGRNDMNVLHAAVINNNIRIVKRLVRRYPPQSEEADEFGRIPLHYAAYLGNVKMVEIFLYRDGSLAYNMDKEGMSAIHIAAKNGLVNVVEMLIKEYPYTSHLLWKKGRNIFPTVERASDDKETMTWLLG